MIKSRKSRQTEWTMNWLHETTVITRQRCHLFLATETKAWQTEFGWQTNDLERLLLPPMFFPWGRIYRSPCWYITSEWCKSHNIPLPDCILLYNVVFLFSSWPVQCSMIYTVSHQILAECLSGSKNTNKVWMRQESFLHLNRRPFGWEAKHSNH